SSHFCQSYCVYFFTIFFFFNDTATTEIYTLSLHDALPILLRHRLITVLTFNDGVLFRTKRFRPDYRYTLNFVDAWSVDEVERISDRKSTRLNSSHVSISYAVFCLKKKKKKSKNISIYMYDS